MRINIKNLCKQIKSDARKGNLIWTLENGINYITNRHWAVKYKDLPREVLITLFSAFAKIPENNKTIMLTRFNDNTIENEKMVEVEQIFKGCEQYGNGEVTRIVTDHDNHKYRVIKKDNILIKVNDAYMAMVDVNGEKPQCEGKYHPISFCDNQLIILPARVENNQEDQMIHELLSAS